MDSSSTPNTAVMASLDSLSEELVDQVCQVLVRRDDTHTLRSISLVSKKYHRIAEARLYERIPLQYWFTDYNKVAGRFWGLHRTLEEGSHLRGHIKSLSFNCIRQPDNDDADPDHAGPHSGVWKAINKPVEDFLVSICSLTPNLESLVLSCVFLALDLRSPSWLATELPCRLDSLLKLKSLELRLPSTCSILDWSQIFAHPSIEDLSILGGVLSYSKKYEELWTEKRSQVKHLKLSLSFLSPEDYSPDTLDLVPKVFSRLEHLQFSVYHDEEDPEMDQLIWQLSTFRGTFERENFRRFDLRCDIESHFWTMTVTNERSALEDHTRKNPDLGRITWFIDQPAVELGGAYSAALSTALQSNEHGLVSDKFVLQVQKYLRACAVAVMSMTGHCQVAMWGNLYEEDLSQMREAAEAKGLAIQYLKSNMLASGRTDTNF